ncbi:MAG: HAD family phosphatase [Anaerolineae bacterium]|nr:HAD family phosphatase [Anaerolineae bacterium]MCB0253883.1 HAD family phosphatase [Anaerolineae bacterium]
MTQYFPAAVIFDMDGLMFDSERLVLVTWTRAMADFGYQASEEVFQRSVGQTMERTNQVLREEYGASFPLDETNQRTSEYYWQTIDAQGAPLKPGLLALLDFLDRYGITRAVASSSDRRNIDRMLASAELADRFAATVAGDEITHGKPAPDIFLRAASLLDVSPGRCLVLEDSEAGARAAAAAGIPCIIVPDLRQPSPEVAALAEAVLPDLNAVHEWLEKRAIPEGPR